MLPAILSFAASVLSGLVLFFLKNFFKKKLREDELHEQKRHQRDVLLMKSMNAIGDLTLANAIALRDGKTNGELKHALATYDKVNREMLDFLIENSVEKQA